MGDELIDEANLRLLQSVGDVLGCDADQVRAVGTLFDRRVEFLLPRRAEHADLLASTLDRFADAFDALELAMVLCSPLEQIRGHGTYDDAESGAGWAHWALTDLFRSGVLVSGEVLALMRAGYSMGALARWRALHEIATRAEFISAGGQLLLPTAERYLRHEEYRQKNELLAVAEHLQQRSPKRSLRSFLKMIHADREALVDEYGTEFRGEYGWAHAQLIESSPKYKTRFERGERQRGPTFEDIEHAVRGRNDDPRRWQHLYAVANAAVHGAPRASIRFEDGKHLRRIGPHLRPMWEPGEATARRLSDLTWAFHLPDHGVEDDDPQVGILDQIVYAISELTELAERTFAAARKAS